MKFLTISALFMVLPMTSYASSETTLRVATFNVSMEAQNYVVKGENKRANITGDELAKALTENHQQIKNIAEIIQRVNPDILLLNEFDNQNNTGQEQLAVFMQNYLKMSQQGQTAIHYPYFYQGSVNTGVLLSHDTNGDGKISLPSDTHGFGFFAGHYGMAVLSKYPIDQKAIRTFQQFKWQDMPEAQLPVNATTGKSWYSSEVLDELRLSSKSHWDIPVKIANKTVHILASHPTPPVFDGPEDRNGKRNHDEIRFWHDYISGDETSQYIYDDQQKTGGLADNSRFVIMGDLNASAVEGDAIRSGIKNLLESNKTQDPLPSSDGAKEHTSDNIYGKHHTAVWRMRADYVLPSRFGFTIKDSGVFWPKQSDPLYRLINSRQASSDHRLVWVDLTLTND